MDVPVDQNQNGEFSEDPPLLLAIRAAKYLPLIPREPARPAHGSAQVHGTRKNKKQQGRATYSPAPGREAAELTADCWHAYGLGQMAVVVVYFSRPPIFFGSIDVFAVLVPLLGAVPCGYLWPVASVVSLLTLPAQQGECNDVTNGWRVGEKHNKTVNADAEATGGRHPLLQRLRYNRKEGLRDRDPRTS